MLGIADEGGRQTGKVYKVQKLFHRDGSRNHVMIAQLNSQRYKRGLEGEKEKRKKNVSCKEKSQKMAIHHHDGGKKIDAEVNNASVRGGGTEKKKIKKYNRGVTQ